MLNVIVDALAKKVALLVFRRVGPDSHRDRLTRCPLEIWSVCWLPVKMVCPCVNVQFIVVYLMVALSQYTCR